MTRHLKVAGGSLAHDDTGTGPLVICMPGMGDVRATYRFSTPLLVAAGFRVVTLDVRGMGETSVKWDDYSVAGLGDDIVKLIEAVDAGPAHVVGNSMAAGAAIVAAANRPDLVRS
ncbi:MAG TPA: alpha/beta fold hydrolase [Candidatus Tumulicola sp.]